jgi:hypothetical protein
MHTHVPCRTQASTDAGTDESSATTEEATQDFGVCTQTQEFDTAPAGSRKLQIFSYAPARA